MQLEFLGYAAVVFVICRALTAEEIFREPRERLQDYFKEEKHPKLLRKLAYMPTCPFCGSFWVTVITVAVANYQLIHDDWRGYVVAHAATMLTANIYMEVFNRLRIDNRKERAHADLKEKEKERVDKSSDSCRDGTSPAIDVRSPGR
jgi:hypothetical protein